jgi:hypothetical protein
MMVPKPTQAEGKNIDEYLDSRPKVTARSSVSPAIVVSREER